MRLARAGELAPDGNPLKLSQGIEVGHIFYLGTKYSQALQATFENEQQATLPIEMGCYGIGVTRIAAAAIEQNHDEAGIIFPAAIAPFTAVVLPLGTDPEVFATALKLYESLTKAGIDVLLDDRSLRAGTAFADLDLLGIPHRIVISTRNLTNKKIAYKARTSDKELLLELGNAHDELSALIRAN